VGAASTLAALACVKLARYLGTHMGWQTTGRAFVVLVIVSVAGFVLTAILAKLFRVRELDSYLRRIRAW
jgi:predicted MFS family arabinose efflux permease